MSVTNNIYGMVLAKNVRETIEPDSRIHTKKSKQMVFENRELEEILLLEFAGLFNIVTEEPETRS